MVQFAAKIREHVRQIVLRTRGQKIGMEITRLTGPWSDREANPLTKSDFGDMMKPFIFVDLFHIDGSSFKGLALHPHSGLATLTYVLEGEVTFEDTTGATGILPQGSVEWFDAGCGAWHGGGIGDSPRTRGYQIWIALPPEQELGAVESVYLPSEEVPQAGPVTVLMGSYGTACSKLTPPSPLNYLALHLNAGRRWRYQPPVGHTVCWIALASGSMLVPENVEAGELVGFEPSNEAIEFHALTDTEFVLGSAVKHPYELSLGRYSVHTNPDALRKGEARIDEIKARLISEGRLPAPAK
jgi:redox-sensitive bicupin YhaK (pirin superfamily)